MKTAKMFGIAAIVALAASVLTGCFVETGRPWHSHYREVVVVRR